VICGSRKRSLSRGDWALPPRRDIGRGAETSDFSRVQGRQGHSKSGQALGMAMHSPARTLGSGRNGKCPAVMDVVVRKMLQWPKRAFCAGCDQRLTKRPATVTLVTERL